MPCILKHLLRAYYVPGTGDTAVNKTKSVSQKDYILILLKKSINTYRIWNRNRNKAGKRKRV